MLRSIPGRLFLEWEAYAELEPFGEVRDDLRIGQLVQTVLAFGGTNVPLTDCLLPFPEEDVEEVAAPKKKDWREIKAAGQMWTAALDARPNTPTEPEATHP